jgi:hypothetical protein
LASLPDGNSCLSGRRPGRKVNAFFMLGVMKGTGRAMRSFVSRQVRQIGAEQIDDLRLEITMKVTVS